MSVFADYIEQLTNPDSVVWYVRSSLLIRERQSYVTTRVRALSLTRTAPGLSASCLAGPTGQVPTAQEVCLAHGCCCGLKGGLLIRFIGLCFV